MSLQEEGTVTFWMQHDNPGWQVDNNLYHFPPISGRDIEVWASKNPGATISIVISGPLTLTNMIHGPIPEILDPKGIFVAISWKAGWIKLLLNGKEVAEFPLTRITPSTLSIRITSQNETPPQKVVSGVIENLRHVFNTISGFLNAQNRELCLAIVNDGLDHSKFNVVSSHTGSWEGLLSGSKGVFTFVQTRFHGFLAILSGYSDRLAEAHVLHKEADARIQQEKAKQERLATIEKAVDVACKLGDELASSRDDLSDEEKKKLIEDKFLKPMEQLANIMVDNQLSIELSESNENAT